VHVRVFCIAAQVVHPGVNKGNGAVMFSNKKILKKIGSFMAYLKLPNDSKSPLFSALRK